MRLWLERALFFLADHAPAGRFAFHAGWPEQEALTSVEVALDVFLALLRRSGLRSDHRYIIVGQVSDEIARHAGALAGVSRPGTSTSCVRSGVRS